MFYFIIFSRTDLIKKEAESLLAPLLSDNCVIDVMNFPDTPVSMLPEGVPSAFFLDFRDAQEERQNPWVKLLASCFERTPFIAIDEGLPFGELFATTAHRLKDRNLLPTDRPFFTSCVQAVAWLDRLSGMYSVSMQEGLRLPDYSHLSFAACLASPYDCSEQDLYSLCLALFAAYPSSFFYRDKKRRLFLFVLYEPTGNFTQLELNRQSVMLKATQESSFFPPFKFGVIHHGLAGLGSSFLEASQVCYVDRLRTPCRLFDEISSPPGQLLKPQKLMEIERSIRTDIQFREGRNAVSYVRQWFEQCRSLSYELEDMKYDLIILYSSIKYVLFDMYSLKLKRIKSGLEVHEIIRISTSQELEQWFIAWLLYTLDNFDLTRSYTGFQLQEVLQFISNHIMDDLSLNTIASYFYVNPSYFSTLFKRETGQTYISYVTKLKMDKACELLAANCKVYEAAQLLGYGDIRHFRNTFKKYHGIPPSEIKQQRPNREEC